MEKSKENLTLEQIKLAAPSVFTKTSSEDTSDKYVHIPTSQVIEDMQRLGWGVVDAKEVKARKRVGFQKHLVVFQNPDIVVDGKDGDTVFPQIVLTNSHDGKNAFVFRAGLFRMICENGLIISTQEFNNVKMRHMGYTFDELQTQILEMVEQLPLTIEALNRMKAKKVTKEIALKFAQKAAMVSFGESKMKKFKIDYSQLIQPTRKEDSGDDVWSLYNIVQEKLVSGDFEYVNGTKPRKARAIKNFTQDIRVNQDLFELAEALV
mgnify:CR=1 FL=1